MMTSSAFRAAIAAAVMLCGASHPLRAQAPSPVNLYVADLTYEGDSIRLGTPRKLTGDRGINSQPSFTADGKSILFVRRDSAEGQGDVFRIDLSNGAETRITSTPEMENSPTVTPDGKLMVIRWTPPTLFREWGPWIYDMNGDPLHGVLPGPDTVGYYVRVDSTTFAMMRPMTRRSIALFDTRTGRMIDYDWPVATLPPQRIPGQRAVSYTRPDSVGGNQIRRLDLVTHDTSLITKAVAGRLIHAWTPRGTILMGKGNAVFAATPPRTGWARISTFTDSELQDVNTYVVSPRGDKLILISPVRPAGK
jgi:hypothetical protein